MSDLYKGRPKTLHVCVGSQCNNNCIMCVESRFCAVTHKKTVEEHKKFIKDSIPGGFSRLVFTFKEPTLAPQKLFPLIKYARELGCKNIMLITNGRLLSYRSFLLKLLKAGLNRIEISLHGPNKKVHESITRAPGSFNQTFKGIMNVYDLSKRFNIDFSINFTITLFNYKSIEDFYSLARSFEPNSIVFNLFSPEMPPETANLLLPKYSQVIGKLMKIRYGQFSLVDIPFCVVPRALTKNLGQMEDAHLLDESNKNDFRRNTRDKSKEKLSFCGECKYNGVCPKPPAKYIDKFGVSEFSPIK